MHIYLLSAIGIILFHSQRALDTYSGGQLSGCCFTLDPCKLTATCHQGEGFLLFLCLPQQGSSQR